MHRFFYLLLVGANSLKSSTSSPHIGRRLLLCWLLIVALYSCLPLFPSSVATVDDGPHDGWWLPLTGDYSALCLDWFGFTALMATGGVAALNCRLLCTTLGLVWIHDPYGYWWWLVALYCPSLCSAFRLGWRVSPHGGC